LTEHILEIQDLLLRFYTYEGIVEALDGVNLHVREGETLGVVGETGCGKSVTGLSTMVLVTSPGKIEGGHVWFKREGKRIDLLKQREGFLRKVRGKDISMVFQDPKSALNPVLSVKTQISEVLLRHRIKEYYERILKMENLSSFQRKVFSKLLKSRNPPLSVRIISKIPILNSYKKTLQKEVEKDIIRLLKDMRLPDPERVMEMYPHQLSGGMAQRIVIAMALACSPKLLIADEPTTNLDVTVQAQILHLIRDLKNQYGSTIQYITHDMGVIAEMCDRVAVMYAGTVVEIAESLELFKNPLHPYTKALLESIPRPGKEFKSIEGTVPSLINPPKGCRFHDRCPYAMDICRKVKPKLIEIKKGHMVQCHLH
jgi:peptide/nickel transport system ATP-binding protein